MRWGSLIWGAAVLSLALPAAARPAAHPSKPARAHAARSAPIPKTSVGFLKSSAQLWSGSLALPACRRPGATALATIGAARRTAPQERHGEVIGEFAGPAPPEALAQARGCASASAGEAATPALLSDGAVGFAKFQTAFAACMADAPHAVGALTLWIDTHCNW